MTILIKTKFNISDDQTNIDKYRLAANITESYIISKFLLQRIIIPKSKKFYKVKKSFEN